MTCWQATLQENIQQTMWVLWHIWANRKIKGSQQGHKMPHNDEKDSFLGSLLVLPVELWKGIPGCKNKE